MVKQTPDEIEALLDGGAWLTSGQIAKLLNRGRTTIWSRLQRGDIRSRNTPSGKRSEWHPDDVRRLVDELRQIHGGTAPTPPPAPGRHAAE